MLSFLNSDKKKTPSTSIISNKTQLLNTLNENFQHILTDIYSNDIIPPQQDFYITLQFILVAISAVAFYINAKLDFDEHKKIQWLLTILFFAINIGCYLYENYLFYFKNNKSSPVCRNLSNDCTYYTKLEYKNKKDKWPEYLLVNNKIKLHFKDFVADDYKNINYDDFKELVTKDVVEKKEN